MTEWRDLSELPEDPGYWAALEKKVMSELGPRVRALPERAEPWWVPRAAPAWVLSGLAAAAAIAALVLVPPRSAAPVVSAGLLTLPDDDPSFVFFVSAPAPPPVGMLVLPRPSGGQDD